MNSGNIKSCICLYRQTAFLGVSRLLGQKRTRQFKKFSTIFIPLLFLISDTRTRYSREKTARPGSQIRFNRHRGVFFGVAFQTGRVASNEAFYEGDAVICRQNRGRFRYHAGHEGEPIGLYRFVQNLVLFIIKTMLDRLTYVMKDEDTRKERCNGLLRGTCH